MTDVTARAAAPHPGMRFREFVGFAAMLMAINAIGIDIMLPALPAMGHALGIAAENQRQWIIAAYVLGFGSTQIVYGPLADRFGRKPVLLIAMSLFALTSLMAVIARDFEGIIAARVLQGTTAAASRVLAVSIVRDCYAGRKMARVMSLTFIVFLAVPILAPSIGQLILLAAPWEGIFLFLSAFGVVLIAWAALRLPETLHPEDRRVISVSEIAAAVRTILGNRSSLGYTLASTLMFGSLMAFINSVQQIFTDIFQQPRLFTIIFAGCASAMGVGAFTNSRIVERYGMRLISHGALLAFLCIATLHLLIVLVFGESIWTFALFQAALMASFSLATSNFGAIAMEPVGHIAGIGAAVQGTIQTIGGALIGIVIGQAYNGTTLPVIGGYVLLGLGALGIILIVERGRLFVAHHAAALI